MAADAARVLVVGAGITGLLAAVSCALAGHRVTVLDRGPIPNPESTSYDQHRVVRALDPTDPAATRRGALAHRRWQELEVLLGGGLYRRVGVVTAWPATDVDRVTAVAAGAGVPVEVVEPAAYPHIGFPVGSVAVHERDAGVLLAERVLRAAAGWLDRQPTVALRPGQQVAALDPDRGRVVLTGGTALSADLVLVAAGPWSRDLVDLPTVLHRQVMIYLRPPADLRRWWECAPSAGRIGADGRAWLLPPGRGTLLKLSSAAACRTVAAMSRGPAADDPTTGDPAADRRTARRLLAASILPGVERYAVVRVAHCHYAVDVRTGRGQLARVGPNVWARAASGGDGFRTAPLVADRIVEALTTTRPSPQMPSSNRR